MVLVHSEMKIGDKVQASETQGSGEWEMVIEGMKVQRVHSLPGRGPGRDSLVVRS